MDYERIEKPQTGMISPSKLRIKLMGPHHKKRDGSTSNSSRTSPSRLDDNEFVKNSLLATESENFDEEVTAPGASEAMVVSSIEDKVLTKPKENNGVSQAKLQIYSKAESGNSNSSSSAVHPMRIMDEENPDYDSNASSSSFEFHKGERAVHSSMRSFSRPMSSKWNDAEKWIVNRQNIQANYSKKNALYNQANKFPMTNVVRVAPDSTGFDHRLVVNRIADTKRVDVCQSAAPHVAFEKFSFVPPGGQTVSGLANGRDPVPVADQYPQSKDLREVALREAPSEDTAAVPAIRAVCMRDMGTEMTPIPSQEPSRTATPVGATTPMRSPTSSVPSTPRRGGLAPTPDESEYFADNGSKKVLSEEELKLKTRREIVALGVQLGKMNIAAWASKEEQEKNKSAAELANMEELLRQEYQKRAAAWEEAEKSKHMARFKREEIKIQAWESQQKAELEAEMRRIESKVEQMKAEAQAKMVKKVAMARQRSEEKRAAAEARKNRDAERTAAQAEYIRQTGRMPQSYRMSICCSWFSKYITTMN